MGKIVTNIATGGLGRPSANTDKHCGLIIEVTALPSGWTNNTVKRIQKVEDLAELNVKIDGLIDEKHIYYHVREFFRLSPNGLLFLALTTDTFDVDKLDLITEFNDNIRIIGYNSPVVMTDTSEIVALNTKAETLFTASALPIRVVFSGINATLNPSGVTAPRVFYDICQDYTTGSLAKDVYDNNSNQCNATGTWLGLISARGVHQKISWVEFGNIAGLDWKDYGIIGGTSTVNYTESAIQAELDKGIVIPRKYPRSSGTFMSGFRTATPTSDDFAVGTNARVIDKACVSVYDATLPNVDRPIYVNPADGKLTPESIAILTEDAYNAIQSNMVAGRTGDDVELSVDPNTGQLQRNAVYIDPDQNVLTTEQIVITIGLVPVGAAKTIIVNIGLRNPAITV